MSELIYIYCLNINIKLADYLYINNNSRNLIMSSTVTKGDASASLGPVIEDEPKICQYTGQIIVEKNAKFLGFSFMTIIIATTIEILLLIGSVFLFIDNKKVRRQALLQGIIIILCLITYGVYLINYEKSKKMHLNSATTSDVPKSDISSSESELKTNK